MQAMTGRWTSHRPDTWVQDIKISWSEAGNGQLTSLRIEKDLSLGDWIVLF